MRESRTYGSVRGARGNSRPYRDRSEMQDCRPRTAVPRLPSPDCRPRMSPRAIRDTAWGGKPDLNTEFHWEGVPSGFSKDPFMLTMDTEKAKVEGLTTTACTAAAPRRGVPKRKK